MRNVYLRFQIYCDIFLQLIIKFIIKDLEYWGNQKFLDNVFRLNLYYFFRRENVILREYILLKYICIMDIKVFLYII